jgi:dephospho-CoA kinase
MIKNLGGKIIYITASPQKRWQRIQKRKEKKDDKISYQKFLKLEKVKTEILIPRIGQKADFKIENNGSKNNFYKECKKILTQVNL